MNRKIIAILGGGLSGLSAALFLLKEKVNAEVHIFEKEEKLGGLVSANIINNNIYEYGPHFFHSKDLEVLNTIKDLSKDILINFNRTILIKFLDNYFTYPLSMIEVLKKLPKTTVTKAFLNMFYSNFLRIFSKGHIFKNSEELLLAYYGKTLYELFFKNYIYNVWGIFPSEFSPDFAQQRIPNITTSIFLNRIIKKFKKKNKDLNTKNYIENIEGEYFTTPEGYNGITKRIINFLENNGARIHLNEEIKEILVQNNIVDKILIYNNKLKNEYLFKVDNIISSLPINEAILSIKPEPPKEVIKSAHKLEFRSLVFMGLLINKPKVLPVSFMYFREHSFNRIYDSYYFRHETNIPDTTILVAEISSSGNDNYWNDRKYCEDRVLRDLFRENILKEEDILEINVYKYKHGYPIYKTGYKEDLQKIFNFISTLNNFKTIGRQGQFQYINGHVAIKMGFEAAKELLKEIL